MNHKIVLRALSVVATIISCMFFASLITQYSIDANNALLSKWIFCCFSSIAIAIFFWIISRNHSDNVFQREILAIIGTGWLLAILIGTLPYLFILPNCSFQDAIFESTSGFTTTGTSVFNSTNDFPRSLLLFRSMTQWIGGFGTLTFFAVLLPLLGAKTKSLCLNGLSISDIDSSETDARTIITSILSLYTIFTIFGSICLNTAGMPMFDAICTSLSTISTGGFISAQAQGIIESSNAIQAILSIMMIIGGTNFIIIIQLIKKNCNRFIHDEEWLWYISLLFITSVVVAVILSSYHITTILSNIPLSTFHVISIATTTGIITQNINYWPIPSHTILILLMLCGSCSGSTAGGIKISRLAIAIKSIKKTLIQSFRPHVVSSIFFNKQEISHNEENVAKSYILFALFFIIIGTIILSITMPNVSLQGILSSSISSFFNIGLGFYEFGSFTNYSEIGTLSKLIHSILMIIGRVEIFAIITLFLPSFWKKFS